MKAKNLNILKLTFLFLFILGFVQQSNACSIVYYIDQATGNIYIANNEDYWLDTKSYIQIMPAKEQENARLWYGWDDFAQGGINAHGLFFDGAVTPEQKIPEGYTSPKGRNIGDEILAYCKNVEEAIAYLEKEKIAISNGHILFGDSLGNASVVEWVDGQRNIISIESNVLIATNYLLSDVSAGNFPCPRYQSILERTTALEASQVVLDLRGFGNIIAGAVQVPMKDEEGREGGTLYTSVIDLSKMQMVLVPRLNNEAAVKLDLIAEFSSNKKKKIKL